METNLEPEFKVRLGFELVRPQVETVSGKNLMVTLVARLVAHFARYFSLWTDVRLIWKTAIDELAYVRAIPVFKTKNSQLMVTE